MFIQAPRVNDRILEPGKVTDFPNQNSRFSTVQFQKLQAELNLNDAISGVLVLTEVQEVVYIDADAQKVLEQFGLASVASGSIPEEVWCVGQALIENRMLFPGQDWRIESRITVDREVVFCVQGRWLTFEEGDCLYLLFTFLEAGQSQQAQAIAEAEASHLTAREQEVWLLYCNHCTYRQIAQQLYISQNTVKKHMKNIHSKRRAALGLNQD